MPYEGEYAQYRPIRRLVESNRIQELLGRLYVQRQPAGFEPLAITSLSDLKPKNQFPSWVLAIDGSHAEVRVQNGYPQAEASYVTVASVLINMDMTRELDQHRPIDPYQFRKTEQAQSIDCVLPSCNVIFRGDRSAKDSFQRALFDVFASHRMAQEGESLLDTYEVLLAKKPDARDQRCPYDDCPVEGTYKRCSGSYSCECCRRRPLYSTDALRIHEGMNLEGTNGAMFAEAMQVWERLWILHCLRTLESRGWLLLLRQIAIILDGPLAVFGHPAWLSQAISAELQRINQEVRSSAHGEDLLWIGIEKTGSFVQHFEDIDTETQGSSSGFPPQSAMLLSDTYIKEHIVFSQSNKPYGRDTYFGRKFFYKTKSGAKIVCSLPFLDSADADTSRADIEQYPRLADALGLLEQLVSSRYPNSLSPIVAAHAEAAIPLHLGARILEKLAKDLIAKEGA